MSSLRHIRLVSEGEPRTQRDDYLDAARECILDEGWRRTTLTEVARRADVSRMTIYRAWPDMPTLLGDLMTREWVGIMTQVSHGAHPDGDQAQVLRDDMVAMVRALTGCEDVVDGSRRGVAIGSRGHLVGSEAVVQRSAVRNFLMRSFHFVLMILTPPATSRIRDTQCGFKLFSRAALPHIVPYMHAEGWIFDIEMLMLAESAPATPVLASDGSVIGTSYGIKVAEVPIAWHEVEGSKMSLVQDSVRMAVGLAVLRASWMLGVYRRRLT